ncbi:MAG: CPBP family intramembrane metalloprotease [Bacteroidetes bacterium]|nr:CPBP family intramembrane metalloprotease [Bacteroidota bacterium]
MDFLSQSTSGKNDFSSYILTICLILVAYGLLGSLPLLIDLRLSGSDLSEGMSIEQISRVLGKNRLLIHLLLPFVFIFAALYLGITRFHKRKFLTVITTSKDFRWKRFFTSFFIWWGVMFVFVLTEYLTGSELILNFKLSTFIPLLLISFLLIPIQTSAEEILFRGYLAQSLFRKIGSNLHTIIITSIFFALMHAFNPEVKTLGYGILSYYFLTGIFLAIITIMDRGLELSMGYHAANNVFAAIMITTNWQAFQTDAILLDTSSPSFGLDSILTLAIIQPALLFLFSKMYNWKNWKKLISKNESLIE